MRINATLDRLIRRPVALLPAWTAIPVALLCILGGVLLALRPWPRTRSCGSPSRSAARGSVRDLRTRRARPQFRQPSRLPRTATGRTPALRTRAGRTRRQRPGTHGGSRGPHHGGGAEPDPDDLARRRSDHRRGWPSRHSRQFERTRGAARANPGRHLPGLHGDPQHVETGPTLQDVLRAAQIRSDLGTSVAGRVRRHIATSRRPKRGERSSR